MLSLKISKLDNSLSEINNESLTITGTGEQRRAFSDVKYYMAPFYQLMNNENTDHQTINIGADAHVSINKLAQIVEDVAHDKTAVRPVRVYLEPRDEVEMMWNQVQNNMGKFQSLFGGSSFIIVDNNMAGEDVFAKVWKRVAMMIRKKVNNPIAKRWITMALKAKDRTR